MYTRILGYLILEGPSDQAYETVSRGVASCVDNEEMLDLGKVCFDYYLRACTSFGVAFHVVRRALLKSERILVHPPVRRSPLVVRKKQRECHFV